MCVVQSKTLAFNHLRPIISMALNAGALEIERNYWLDCSGIVNYNYRGTRALAIMLLDLSASNHSLIADHLSMRKANAPNCIYLMVAHPYSCHYIRGVNYC